jgi:hypothetical protein
MIWSPVESKIAKLIECLRDKSGRFVGYIIRFNDKEVTYAWTEHGPLGCCMGDGAAKDLVEQYGRKK